MQQREQELQYWKKLAAGYSHYVNQAPQPISPTYDSSQFTYDRPTSGYYPQQPYDRPVSMFGASVPSMPVNGYQQQFSNANRLVSMQVAPQRPISFGGPTVTSYIPSQDSTRSNSVTPTKQRHQSSDVSDILKQQYLQKDRENRFEDFTRVKGG